MILGVIIMKNRCSIQQGEKITVDQSKVLKKIDGIDCSVFIGPPGIGYHDMIILLHDVCMMSILLK